MHQDKLKKITEVFEKTFGNTDGLRYFAAPGRVNLIGEHIDYCGGYVFPAALTLDTIVAAKPNGTRKLRMAATTLDGIYEADLDNIDAAQNLKWGNYQAGVAKELMLAGYKLEGLDMVYMVTVPFGSGLSSSASIELATGIALTKIFNGNMDNVQLAQAGQRAENKFCGVNCGIMDQFASAMGKEDHAIMLNCATLEYQYVPVSLGDNVLILANTNKKHKLGESKYNERRAEVEEGLKIMQAAEIAEGVAPDDVKKDLCSYDVEDFKKLLKYIENPVIAKRVEHVICENARVKTAVETLKAGDLNKFGELLRDANQSIRYLYEATGDELDAMFDAAQGLDYCIGSRMTGGGFGGCTVNIVNKNHIEDFKATVGKKYFDATGNEALFYVCEIGDGAREIFIQEDNSMDIENEELDGIIILSDEDGNEETFEFVDMIEYDDVEYAVLLPVDENDNEVVILQVENGQDGEDESYIGIEDEKILKAVFEIFKERAKDDFDFVD